MNEHLRVLAVLLLSATTCLGALPQEHEGYTCVQPEEFDIWAGLPTRQYLNGVWDLLRFEVKDEEALATLLARDMAWWRRELAANAKPQIVPIEWHLWYGNSRPSDKRRKHKPTSRAGMYRARFTVPAQHRARRAILHFDHILGNAEIHVNGKPVHTHSPLFGRSSGGVRFLEEINIDITQRLHRSGENELTVRVIGAKEGKNRWTKQPEPSPTGIGGPVWIDYRPQTFVRELYVAPDTERSTLTIDLVRDARAGVGPESNWRILAMPWTAAAGTRRYEQTARIRWAGDQARVALAMPGAIFWEPANPFLYRLEIRDERGDVVARERFGFRTFRPKGEKFLLNGKPIWLRGILASRATDRGAAGSHYNRGGKMRDWLTRMRRQGNVNHMRIHSGSRSSIFFDVCDELGLLISDEIRAPSHLLKADDPRRRADYIAVKSVEMFFDEAGKLKPKSLDVFKRLVLHTHNHPSVVMYTTGNENSPRPFFYKYARAFYETVHRCDRQDRPVSSWGSGVHLERAETCEKLPTDYFDFHNYDETLSGGTWLNTRSSQWQEVQRSKKKAHLGDIPIVNGETIGIWTREHTLKYWAQKAAEGATPREMFLDWVRTKGPFNDNQFGFHSRIMGRIGIQPHASLASFRAAHAASFKQLLETQRRELDFIQGILQLSMDDHDQNMQAMGTVYSPLWISAYPFRLNHLPGDTVTLVALLHNGTLADSPDLTAEAAVCDASGRSLQTQTLLVEPLRPDERRRVSFSLPIPAAAPAQSATLRLSLRAGETERCRNTYAIRIVEPSHVASVGPRPRVAVYESDGKGGPRVSTLLAGAGIAAARLTSLERVSGTDVLIVGPGAMDEHILENGGKLLAWLKAGGKLLVFEQRHVGPYPFLPDYALKTSRPRPYANPLVPEHPAFAGLDVESFRDWNGTGTLYDHWINRGADTVDESVLVSSVSVLPQGRAVLFGMLAAEMKVGKGAVFLSQIRGFDFYRKDPAAKRYVDNVLNYALSPAFGGKWAVPVRLERAPAAFYPEDKLLFVDLTRRLNSSFHDKQPGDGKGGWADLGNANISRIRTGRRRFHGIAYDILKAGRPTQWKSCIVLGGSKRPNLPRSAAGIDVNERLKKLAFLHTAMWVNAEPDQPVGRYTVHYADGAKLDVPVVHTRNIGDWWAKRDQKQARVAETVLARSGGEYAVYAWEWDNPHPEKEIESVDMHSEGNAILALLAVTGVRANDR